MQNSTKNWRMSEAKKNTSIAVIFEYSLKLEFLEIYP